MNLDTDFLLEFVTPSLYELGILIALLLIGVMLARLGIEMGRIGQPCPVCSQLVDEDEYPNDDQDGKENR